MQSYSLKKLLLEVIKEASTDDIKKISEASSIVDYIKDKIKNYKNVYYVVHVYYKDLEIVFTPVLKSGSAARYDHKNKKIVCFGCKIEIKPNLSVEFNSKFLIHELIHYFDLKSFGGNYDKFITSYMNKTNVGKLGAQAAYSNYYNDPHEMNAHYFEYVLPDILQIIKQDNKIVQKNSFENFYKDIKKSKEFSSFFNELTPENQKRVLKRIATLYNELKKSPEDLKDLTNVNVDNLEIEKKKYTWINKLMNYFKD